jgi:sensor domain CHASE-containing protein
MSLPDFDQETARDEIIEEVRAIRDALAAEFDYDISRLFEAAKRWEAESDRPKVAPSPRRLSSAV